LKKIQEKLAKNPSHNSNFLSLVAISTLLTPKAGLNWHGIPLTINLMIVTIFLFLSLIRHFERITQNNLRLLSLLLPWTLLCFFRSSPLIESRTLRFGLIYWCFIAPIFWVTVDALNKSGISIDPKIAVYCSFGATLFGLGQFIWGLNFLKVTGLTIAWGDSYERKNLSIFNANDAIGTKIPSTFQGGNIWGQCASLILIWVVVFRVWRIFNSRILQIATVISPSIAVFLSFSRTAIAASVVSLAIYFLRAKKRIFGFVLFLTFVYIIVSTTSQYSLGRYSLNSFTNSAGRTMQWANGFANYSIIDWLFGRSGTSASSFIDMEGILGLFSQVGIVGFFLLLSVWMNIFKGNFKWIGVAILICLILDSTYVSPPLLLIPSLLVVSKVEGLIDSNLRNSAAKHE
jgi:hypothetical protein